MAATTASILERTAVAAADANNVDLDAIANNLASAARRVRVLEKRRAKMRAPRSPPPRGSGAARRDALRQRRHQRAEDAARGPGRAAAREHRVDRAAARGRTRRARGHGRSAPGRDPTRDGGRARRARRPARAATLAVLHGPRRRLSRPMVAAVADDAAPDEPGGWLDVALGGGWERRWCAVVSGPHGPRLEMSKSPGAPPDDVALLVGCEVEGRRRRRPLRLPRGPRAPADARPRRAQQGHAAAVDVDVEWRGADSRLEGEGAGPRGARGAPAAAGGGAAARGRGGAGAG